MHGNLIYNYYWFFVLTYSEVMQPVKRQWIDWSKMSSSDLNIIFPNCCMKKKMTKARFWAPHIDWCKSLNSQSLSKKSQMFAFNVCQHSQAPCRLTFSSGKCCVIPLHVTTFSAVLLLLTAMTIYMAPKATSHSLWTAAKHILWFCTH